MTTQIKPRPLEENASYTRFGHNSYLLHPLVISILLELSQAYFNYDLANSLLFIITAAVTWIVSLFTYSYIERPFLVKNNA